MKLSAKLFVVSAIAVAVWCGSSPKDRLRWLAALGMSKATATELRIENTRDKFHADQAAEQARWRGDDRAQPAEPTRADVVLNAEAVCNGLAEKEQMLHAQGKQIEDAARRIKAACSGESIRMSY
jgi:hypothetical protein